MYEECEKQVQSPASRVGDAASRSRISVAADEPQHTLLPMLLLQLLALSSLTARHYTAARPDCYLDADTCGDRFPRPSEQDL